MNQQFWTPSIDGSTAPLYTAILQALSEDIKAEKLKIGTKLPTQRELADSLKVALGTVTRAYAEAERRGLIRSDGRRGTFVGRPLTSRAFLSAIAQRPDQGIDLCKNHPVYHLDPDLKTTLRRLATDRRLQSLLHYAPAEGLPQHREAGAKWFGQLGASVEAESVFVTAGAQHAFAAILSAIGKPGDVIGSERFTYTGVRALAEQMGLPMVGIPADEEGIIPEALESLCRQRNIRFLYINPTISNPSNCLYPITRREEIAKVAERNNLLVIEDEIMRPLVPEQTGFISAILPEQTFTVISTSKVVAAGIRVGFAIVPPQARQRMTESLNASCLGLPPLTSELFSIWLEDGTAQRVIARRRQDTAARQKLAEKIFGGFAVRTHPASYHLWLTLPEGWSSSQFAMEAQLRGVVVAPGEAFAVDVRPFSESIRISVVAPPDLDELEKGLKIIAELLRGRPGHHMAPV